jgi:integrase
MATQLLSDTTLKSAKPSSKPIRLSDGGGLYLLVQPTGAKWWRLDYSFAGKRKTLSLGVYPSVTLSNARKKTEEARQQVANGADPSDTRKEAKEIQKSLLDAERRIEAGEPVKDSFEDVCREWLNGRKDTVETAQHKKTLARMVKDVFPWIGNKPIAAITAPEVLSVLRRIDQRGARYSAHRVRSEISRTFRYAIATGRAERDPCPDLQGAIPPAKETHFAALVTPAEAGELLRAIDGFSGTFVVQCALRLAPLLFVRPGELRKAEWASIDFERSDWRYLVTKTKTEHLVPLAPQAVAILKELHALTGHGRYVFPGARDKTRPMSDAAINAALRRMGYDTKEEITGHGFRAMARTILAEELHQKPEVIEHQLAHSVPDALGTAYNRTKFLKERKAMMRIWADYLDVLKAGAKIIPLHADAA